MAPTPSTTLTRRMGVTGQGSSASSSSTPRPDHDMMGSRSDNKADVKIIVLVIAMFVLIMTFYILWLVGRQVRRSRRAPVENDAESKAQSFEEKSQSFKKMPEASSRQTWLKGLVSVNESHVTSQDSCTICLDPLLDTDLIRPLPCNHIFHQQCFDDWFWKKEQRQHDNCPVCRSRFLEGPVVPEKALRSG